MAMIQLHWRNGEAFTLNTDKIIMFYPDGENTTAMIEQNDDCGSLIYVKESYRKVLTIVGNSVGGIGGLNA